MINKEWWRSIKQQQGFFPDDSIPLLSTTDGSVVIHDRDKAQLLAAHFSTMSVADPERAPPAVPTLTKATLGNITITKEEVLQQLKRVDPKKALGPDNISLHIMKRCATQLAAPLASIFQRCVSSQ